MLHLFNKVYLDVDFFVDQTVDRIVISKNCGQDMLPLLAEISPGKLLANGLNFDDVIGSDKTFKTVSELFDFCYKTNLSTGKKLHILCDQEAYMKLASWWFKGIFKNINADRAYDIILADFYKFCLVGKWERIKVQDNYYQNIPSREDFISIFDSTVVDDNTGVLEATKPFRSVEYLFASYFFDGSYKEELKSSVLNLATRSAESYTKDIWRAALNNILQKSIREKIEITKEYTLTNLLEVFEDPDLMELRPAVANALPVGEGEERPEFNFQSLSSKGLEKLIKMGKFFWRDDPRVSAYLSIVSKKDFTDEDFQIIIDMDLNPPDDIRFWKNKDKDTINMYILDIVFEAYRNGQSNILEQYSLK
jgi:hypothetical protein